MDGDRKTQHRKLRDASQEDRAEALLRSRGDAWTPAPELSKISLQYCRVIASLRARGFQIENRVEIRNGKRRGFYRLITPAPITPKAPTEPPKSLFGDLTPERKHLDLG